jgi:hypothetical protein
VWSSLGPLCWSGRRGITIAFLASIGSIVFFVVVIASVALSAGVGASGLLRILRC